MGKQRSSRGRPSEKGYEPTGKDARTGKIIENVKVGKAATLKELAEITGYSVRTLYHDMDRLSYWNLLELKNGKITWLENKRIWQNEVEFNMALRHSKFLVDSNNQRIDAMDSLRIIERFAYPDRYELDYDEDCLLEHIKSGYPDYYETLQKYRKATYNLEKEIVFKRVSDPRSLVQSELVQQDPVFEAARKYSKPEYRKALSEARIKREENRYLADLFRGNLASMTSSVKHLNPLRGFCANCPGRRNMIKEK